MAMVGRIIRQAMRDEELETPERVTERIRARAAGRQAHAEALERFGPIDVDNAEAFVAWQDARMRALIAAAESK
jgi:hypothetical protein